MILYIDMIAFYLQKAGGITVVWKELITRMLRDQWKLVLILQNAVCDNLYFEEIMSFEPDFITETGPVRINRYAPVICPMEEGSQFISTYYRTAAAAKVKQFTLVHDFTYEYYVRGIRKLVHQCQKRRSIKSADVIICVSENTKRDLLTFYPEVKHKEIHVIYNGVSDIYSSAGRMEEGVTEENNSGPYFVYVGSRAKYKRFDLAVDIAAHYGFRLLIVGGGALKEEERRELEKKLGGGKLYTQAGRERKRAE